MTAHASRVRPGALDVLTNPTYTVHSFVQNHRGALVAAVEAVAGSKEAARAKALLRHLAAARLVTDEDLAELVRLHRVLSLDVEVEDPRWMALDPDSEEVLRICLMTDALATLLRRCDDCREFARLWSGATPSAGTDRARVA